VKGKAERRGAHRYEKDYNVAVMKVNCAYAEQGCIHSTDSVEKYFLNGSKRNKAELNIIETLICNCWTNDYTLYQLDEGKSVQGGIECVTVCHLLSPFLWTCVHLHCKLSFKGYVVATS
jgi:hypothetical protein